MSLKSAIKNSCLIIYFGCLSSFKVLALDKDDIKFTRCQEFTYLQVPLEKNTYQDTAHPTVVDASHYSTVFGEVRNYRIYLPPSYYSIPQKHYPVIYFFHGWSQRYFSPVGVEYSNFDAGDDNGGDNIDNYVSRHEAYKGPKARISNYTKPELHTLLTLWYISRMPLMIGGYLPQTDAYTLQLLQNKGALEVNRNSINNRQIKFKNAHIIWAADIPAGNDKYVAFFNQWESVVPIQPGIAWKQLGLTGNKYKVRDLWSNKELGEFKDGFSASIVAHGAGLFKVYE